MFGIIPGIEDHLTIVDRIKFTIEVDIGTSKDQSNLFGDLLKAFNPFGCSTISASFTGATGEGLTHSHDYP
jgi:hypothetical protein